MNKKGFTLVELLAVIAILAILVVVALPNVIGMFGDAKKNSFLTECKQIYKVAQEKYISDSLFETRERTYARCQTQNCGTELDLSGRSNIQYFIKFNKAGQVVEFHVTDGDYQYSYEDVEPLILTGIEGDEVKQIAELNEGEIITLSCDGKYREPQEITLCFYYQNDASNPQYLSRNVTCMDDKTLGECLGTTTDVYYYAEEFKTCINSKRGSITMWGCGVSHPGASVVKGCYDSYANRKQVSCDEKASKYTSGCLSINAKASSGGCCLDGDMLVEVWDKKKKKRVQKKLKDITYDDLVLVWNFDEGKLAWAKPFWIMQPFESNGYLLLTFDDGSTLKVVAAHRLFDYENGRFESTKNMEVGFKTINSDGKILTLTNIELVDDKCIVCNVITEKHFNIYANGILTSRGSNNIYEIKDMKFVKNNVETISRDDLSDVDEEYFEKLRLGERPVNMYGTKEQTIKHIEELVANLIKTKQK